MTTKTLTEKQMVAKEKAIYNLFKKITKGNNERPALKNIIFKEDGSAVATDGVTLLKVEDFHEKKERMLLDGQTRNKLDNNDLLYPETDRLFPSTDHEITFNVKEIYNLIKEASKGKSPLDEKTKCTTINLNFSKENKQLSIKPVDKFFKIEFIQSKINIDYISDDYEVNVAIKRLLDCLLMFKQSKVETVSLKNTGSKIRPFVLQADNIKCILAPVRVM